MLHDVTALFTYISTHLPQVDPKRIAVVGTSAGGYLARLAGLYANPQPCAIVSMQGSEHFSAPFHLHIRYRVLNLA